MKLDFVRTALSAVVLLGLTVSAPAQVPGRCGPNSEAGEWGLTFTGTVITPGGAATLAGVSRVVVEPGGHLTGSQTSSTGGVPGKETFDGTITADPDCTGKVSASIFDQSGTLIRTAKWDVVLVDTARKMIV